MANIAKILTMDSDRHVEGTFVVSDLNSMPFKDPMKGKFLVFNLSDKTGQIAGKIWKDASENKKVLKSAQVFEIQGKISKYKGVNQLFVSSVEPAKKFDPTNFVLASKFNPDIMWEDLVEILDENITDKNLKLLWERYRDNENFVNKFKICPGGKGNVHHAYIAGLLEHTLNVVRHCVSYCDIYNISTSVICMGAFLHDLGKMLAYTYDLVIGMTDIGRLHSHINLSYALVTPIIDKLEISKEERNKMKLTIGHLILSHHGTLEQGSAVKPMTPEAILLSKADITDSEYNLATIYTEKITEGNWSGYDVLKGKYYYKE